MNIKVNPDVTVQGSRIKFETNIDLVALGAGVWGIKNKDNLIIKLLLFFINVLLQPKMKIMSLITHPHVVPNP